MKKSGFLVFLLLSIQSCGVDSDVLEYSKDQINITLIFPEDDSECTEGIIVSDTQSELVFEWSDANDNSPYIVHLTNLVSSQTELIESNDTEVAIILDRGVAYSWYVTGKINSSSEIWSFYNEGPSLESTIPYPAIAISPVSGASISQTSTTVNLIWKSEDPDNDIVSYDLFFGEAKDPQLYGTDVTDTRFNDIPVEAGKTYYWKIITKDSISNKSTSEVFTFSVG
ncbi:hypothetical protein SAMN04488007_3307 [Maribacter aquivivus]|uniref:Fibronectin type-III domain-containing protein n=1 Tax=Maribacter aquivivus TaxID=228958 RepID=A0A1M6TPD7_9FLAO|nr:hypothetical protein [Maribacter aquivivus]SHK58845.1 hypothetical protein SAMN04488007_3307 [Maribacter aquivivus]